MTARRISVDLLRGAACLAAAGVLAACSTPAPPPQTAAQKAPLPVVTVAAPAPTSTAPLTPVVAPSDPPEMAALARRLASMIDGAKPQITPYPIDLAGLPRATVHAPLDTKTTAKLDRTKLTEDPDLSVKPADGYARSYMISFGFKDPSKVQFGRVKVTGSYGANEGWFGQGYSSIMNIYQTCGRSGDLVPVHWETVRIEKNQLIYVRTDGVLDRQSCTVLRVKSSTATAKPLLPGGILFGFRACEGSCAENEVLTLLFPRSTASAAGALGGGAERAAGSFSVVSFPIQRGGGGAFVARIQKHDVTAWQLRPEGSVEPAKAKSILDDSARLGAMFLTSFELGVEVSQARDDEAPIAIAYMDIDPAALPPPPAPTITINAPVSSAGAGSAKPRGFVPAIDLGGN